MQKIFLRDFLVLFYIFILRSCIYIYIAYSNLEGAKAAEKSHPGRKREEIKKQIQFMGTKRIVENAKKFSRKELAVALK